MINLCVLGPSGRMGQMVLDEVARRSGITVVSAVDAPGSACIGTSVAPGVTATDDVAGGLAAADVYIDFTAPGATASTAAIAADTRCAAVIGTTGLSESEMRAVDALAAVCPVVMAPNFSLAVNVLLGLAEQAARALGPSYDLEIVELHHKRKRDAPSGTAIALAQRLARGRDLDLDTVGRYSRAGEVGERPANEIGVVAVRGGDIVGEHTAYLIGENERLELTHRASSRRIFAEGAVTAADWLAGKSPGHYTMTDVLGL